jgi:hypothetical protein
MCSVNQEIPYCMERDSSLSCSLELLTSSYPESHEFSPQSTPSILISIKSILMLSHLCVDFFRLSNQTFVCISHITFACYLPCPSHPSLLDLHNINQLVVHIMELLTMQFSPASYHFLTLRSRCSQHPVMEHSVFVFS